MTGWLRAQLFPIPFWQERGDKQHYNGENDDDYDIGKAATRLAED